MDKYVIVVNITREQCQFPPAVCPWWPKWPTLHLFGGFGWGTRHQETSHLFCKVWPKGCALKKQLFAEILPLCLPGANSLIQAPVCILLIDLFDLQYECFSPVLMKLLIEVSCLLHLFLTSSRIKILCDVLKN